MASVQYNGHFPAIYPDYVDAATGKTLTVQPGQSYTVNVAPGRNAGLAALPGDGRWGASFGYAAEEPHEEGPGDPPAAPEPPPAASKGESTTETTPAAPEGAPASPESEE